MTVSERLRHEFRQRLQGFVNDGYVVRSKVEWAGLWWVRLKNMPSGNEIILSLNLYRGELVQKTNGAIRFTMKDDTTMHQP